MGIDNIKELLLYNKNLKIIPTHFRDNTREKLKLMNLKNIFIVDDGYEFELED